MAIDATYVSSTTLTATYDAQGNKDLRGQCPVGVTIRADCGADGLRGGVVSAVSYADPVTTIVLEGDWLTPNLVSFEHGNDTPESLCSHAANHTLTARDSLARVLASMPAHFSRDAVLAAKTASVAADRYTLAPWQRLGVNIGDSGFYAADLPAINLALAASWDQTTTGYTVAANRAGKDFYVYGCNDGGTLKILLSANATSPDGYDATTSRKLGGFHCLCGSVGTISGHPLSGYVTGDILPASAWDLGHRPVSAPEGMVYVAGIGKWADIYLASVSGETLVSAYGGTIVKGNSTPLFDWFDFTEWYGRIGKLLPTQSQFMAMANGGNEGTNIVTSLNPVTTGGHSDTSGRRMISNCGCEDCCGVMWQWLQETGGPYGAASWSDVYTDTRTAQRGQGFDIPHRGIAGGGWKWSEKCGSRSSAWDNAPTFLADNFSARGLADRLACVC